jgi:hypothetical protein
MKSKIKYFIAGILSLVVLAALTLARPINNNVTATSPVIDSTAVREMGLDSPVHIVEFKHVAILAEVTDSLGVTNYYPIRCDSTDYGRFEIYADGVVVAFIREYPKVLYPEGNYQGDLSVLQYSDLDQKPALLYRQTTPSGDMMWVVQTLDMIVVFTNTLQPCHEN